jgi:hypothetical protein
LVTHPAGRTRPGSLATWRGSSSDHSSGNRPHRREKFNVPSTIDVENQVAAPIVMATVPKSAKVAALQDNPKVALTIDQGAFPPKVLLIPGTAEVKLVEGIPDGYLTAGRKVMTDDQYPEWVAGVQGLYDEMVVITITPTWAKLLDFETTIPKAVEDLINEKAAD